MLPWGDICAWAFFHDPHLNHDDTSMPHFPSILWTSVLACYFFIHVYLLILLSPVAMETSLPSYTKWRQMRVDAFMTIWAFFGLGRLIVLLEKRRFYGLECIFTFQWKFHTISNSRWEQHPFQRTVFVWHSLLLSFHVSVSFLLCPQVNRQGQIAIPVARRWLAVAMVLVVR